LLYVLNTYLKWVFNSYHSCPVSSCVNCW